MPGRVCALEIRLGAAGPAIEVDAILIGARGRIAPPLPLFLATFFVYEKCMPKRPEPGRPRTGSRQVVPVRLAPKQGKKIAKLAKLESVDRSTILRMCPANLPGKAIKRQRAKQPAMPGSGFSIQTHPGYRIV
jgi:hypothetical protein